MRRGVGWYLVGSCALLALAGCGGGWFLEQREPWRNQAEVACLKSGEVKITPSVAQLPAINGPGVCGADFPLKVAALGESTVLGFADDPRPPGTIPRYAPVAPRPAASSGYGTPTYPQPTYPGPNSQRPYGSTPNGAQAVQPGAPMVLQPGADPDEDEPDEAYRSATPGYGTRPRSSVSRPTPLPDPSYRPYSTREGLYDPPRSQPPEPYVTPPPRTYGSPGFYRPQPAPPAAPLPPLGPSGPALAGGPAAIVPAATLACPMVSALDQWMSGSVQPASLRWFGQPVAEIKQISAYSCRGMNGNPRARISEHAFGNALDIAAFTLADGRKVTVRDGWRGLPEERGFLHDVHAAACQQFSTVLGPGSNVYHYDHLHLDLMRRSSGQGICNPPAIPGDVVAGRAGGRTGDVTGSVGTALDRKRTPFDKKLPAAVAGED
jgi:Extensin-like protein C-terminus